MKFRSKLPFGEETAPTSVMSWDDFFVVTP